MITNKDFIKATKEFDNVEKRGSFYKMAVDLINNNFEIEAYFLILATWNFARFRFAINSFDIKGFKDLMNRLSVYFNHLKGQEFKTINFDKYHEDIKKIFIALSSIKGIEFTGASKIMHLKNRSIFVMWDGYIKGEKPIKYYKELKIAKTGNWDVKRYKNNPDDYLQFLKDMQKRFKNINFQSKEKTFAKAIDEFNYVNITLPIQNMMKGL
jgi:hypothetical protein